MENINKVFSNNKLNVASQYLQTDSDVGYVVMGGDTKEIYFSLLNELNSIPNTIRARKLH